MMKNELELRMYAFVPYQLMPLQKGIQSGHAVQQYDHKFKDKELTVEFITKHMTWIVLDGGTTNSTRDFEGISQGTLNQITDSLADNEIDFAYFTEPDLQDALTAVCFICDERVFNFEDYPDFIDHMIDLTVTRNKENFIDVIRKKSMEELIEDYPTPYKLWIKKMGGEKNVFLRDLIRGKRKAM